MYAKYFQILPRVGIFMFAEEEQAAVRRTNDALHSFAWHLTSFRYALQLFDMCIAQISSARLQRDAPAKEGEKIDEFSRIKIYHERIDPYSRWLHIAARDGSMQLFHAGKALSAVGNALGMAPTLASYVDHKERRVTERLFESSFPGHEDVRHTIGHTAEFSARRNEHAAKGAKLAGYKIAEDVSVMILDDLNGRTYRATYEGRVVSYEISEVTLNKLESILNHLCKSFEPLEQVVFNPHEKLKPRERGAQLLEGQKSRLRSLFHQCVRSIRALLDRWL
jgi:hypothetical protein